MQRQPFDLSWQFALAETLPQEAAAWRTLDLPHDWSIELPRSPGNPSGISNGWFTMGRGWYRKNLSVPPEWAGKKVLLEFEGVYMNAEIWLDENFLGCHPYGYTSFHVDLTPYLRPGKEQTLKVMVDNAAQLNSRWYSGSGIYRHVWLLVAEPVHVAPWGVFVTTPDVTEARAMVQVSTRIWNASEGDQLVVVRSQVIAPDGAAAGMAEVSTAVAAGAQSETIQVVSIQKPQLWSVEKPSLYQVKTEVLQKGIVLDTAVTTFGIRSLAFIPQKGFFLNGQPLKLKGGCVHHDNGVLGSASFDRAEERKVEIHKASGYNAIRTAHNPPAPSFLDACDRLGMLVLDEAFDCWREGKNPYDYHQAFDDWWGRDIDSMVQRDRNHPSVIIWSIGNEVMERDGRSGGREIARRLAERVRHSDSTRPVTSAICGVWDSHHTWEDTDVVFDLLDVGGYNYQYKQYRPDHERNPDRLMMGTESTAMEAYDQWRCVEELDYVIGDFVWTSLDYLGESGIGRQFYEEIKGWAGLGPYPWHQANCGDLDLCGFKRPQSYYRDILWKNTARPYIAVHDPIPEGKQPQLSYWAWPEVWPNWTWPGREGQTFKVDVYSACPTVELFLNDQSLGIKATDRHIASFELVYTPGELKAVGIQEGQEPVAVSVRTAGSPAQFHLTADRLALKARPGDLCYVTVEIVDAQGTTHPAADRPVLFSVIGAGSLLAVGSANPISTEDYTGSRRTTYRGRSLVVLKANGQPGEIRLRAMADGLESAEIAIQVA